MSAPTRRRHRPSEARMRYAYQVRMNYIRLFQSDPRTDLGVVRWDRLIREHWSQRVLPMDAARGIHATEVADH